MKVRSTGTLDSGLSRLYILIAGNRRRQNRSLLIFVRVSKRRQMEPDPTVVLAGEA